MTYLTHHRRSCADVQLHTHTSTDREEVAGTPPSTAMKGVNLVSGTCESSLEGLRIPLCTAQYTLTLLYSIVLYSPKIYADNPPRPPPDRRTSDRHLISSQQKYSAHDRLDFPPVRPGYTSPSQLGGLRRYWDCTKATGRGSLCGARFSTLTVRVQCL